MDPTSPPSPAAPAAPSPSARPSVTAGDALRAAAWVAVVVLTFPSFWRPAGTGTDASWAVGISLAVECGLAFGRDVLFTYGPLGFVLEPLDFERLLPHVIAWRIALYGTWWASLWLAARQIRPWPAAVLFLAIPVFTIDIDGFQTRWVTAVVNLLVVACCAERRWCALPAAFLTGAALLAKFNIGLICGVSLAAWAVLDATRRPRRRAPWLAAVAATFVGAVVIPYVAYGGPLRVLPGYLRYSWLVTQGYSAQMSLVGPAWEVWLGLGQLGLALAGVIVGWAIGARNLAVAALLAFPLFGLFKAGFVRHDGHAMIHFMSAAELLSCGLIAVRDRWRLAAWSGIVAAVAFSCTAWRLHRWPNGRLFNPGHQRLAQAWNWLDCRRAAEEKARRAAARDRLPRVLRTAVGDAPVDVYPLNLCAVRVNGLNWRPRLVLQSYSAYHPVLDAAGAALFEGPAAPPFVIYEHVALDGQHPWMVDPQTLLAVLRWYDPGPSSRGALLLRRRVAPRFGPPALRGRTTLELGQTWDVPQFESGLTLVAAEFRLSLVGRIAEAAFKVMPPDVDVVRGDGSTRRHRLVWRNAASGLLLSHLPNGLDEVRSVFEGQPAGAVRQVRFLASGRHFEPRIAVTWWELPVERLPP